MAALFLGSDPETNAIQRLSLERHALTIAGSRMGKGACQIIPTLREWPSSTIVIDPKGEAVRETVRQRLDMGQKVAILDPMGLVDAAFSDYRTSFDPLSLVRDGGAGFRDIQMIADGLVLTSGQERDPHWNESALSLIAGCLAYLIESEGEEAPHLGDVLTMVRVFQDPEKRPELLDEMASCCRFGGAAASTAALLRADTSETNSVLSTTARHLRFLGDEDIAHVLLPAEAGGAATLNLEGLRDGTLSLYLVIDPGALVLHARFLRLFVRMALAVMMRTEFADGHSSNAPCLFVLDEFFSLGKIGDIQKAAGLMPGYGVHLWPILQDWGQLVELYGAHGAQTFLANADAVSVFGISDHTTLAQISGWFDVVSTDEIRQEALALAGQTERSELWRKFGPLAAGRGEFVQNQQLAVLSALLQSLIGRPRKSPAEIQYHLGKPFGAQVAQRVYVFLRTGEILDLVPTPYFG